MGAMRKRFARARCERLAPRPEIDLLAEWNSALAVWGRLLCLLRAFS
jgi:hypothetical protein